MENQKKSNRPFKKKGKPLIKRRAIVDKNQRGFAFLIFDEKGSEDAFVPPNLAQGLFPGDRVEALIDGRGKAVQIKVLEHRFREVVGKFKPHPRGISRGGWVIYERKRAREVIYVPQLKAPIQDGTWVHAQLEFHSKGQYSVTAKILTVYGKDLPPSADIVMVSSECGLFEEHSEDAVKEAKQHRLEIPGKDLKGRRDLRSMSFITIDGETARDFDDAIFVERSNSDFILWVAIADVSHYVQEGSQLDQEARLRATSVYFPERAFHMLPGALSENLCSLRPREPRLVLVAKMKFNKEGQSLETELMEAVIESKRRATYTEIQSEWEKNKKALNWEFTPHFALYEILKIRRQERGSVDFELPEAEVKVDIMGDVVSIENRSRLETHRLIEEFMIAANESVTDWMMKRNWPFVYRVHEEPSQIALEKFQALAATVGIEVNLKGPVSPKIISDFIRGLEGHRAEALLNMSLLRSMKQAVYSSEHGVHYGLASSAYTHFTSPIRRYPDLVVHRLIRMALRNGGGNFSAKLEQRKKLEQDLTSICEHCSYRERLAADAERESIRIKQVRMVAKHLGEEFSGKVIGMIESGLFVQIQSPFVEGRVSVESMVDDSYEYDEDKMVFYGRRKKQVIRMGDAIRVRALKADLEKRQIDLLMVK